MSKIQRWGNSLAIRIPQTLAGQLSVGEGTEVAMVVREGELVVRPKSPKKISLARMLKSCKTSQLHGETDFGVDVGREVVE